MEQERFEPLVPRETFDRRILRKRDQRFESLSLRRRVTVRVLNDVVSFVHSFGTGIGPIRSLASIRSKWLNSRCPNPSGRAKAETEFGMHAIRETGVRMIDLDYKSIRYWP